MTVQLQDLNDTKQKKYEYHYTAYGPETYGTGVDIVLSAKDRESLTHLVEEAQEQPTAGAIKLNLVALAIVAVSEFEFVTVRELSAICNEQGSGWFELTIEGRRVRTGKQAGFRQVPIVW